MSTTIHEGLAIEDRRAIYQKAGLSDASARQVEAMVASAGERDVGRGALRNVVVELQSKKNGAVRVVESHTCELIFAYECELDPEVRGYYAQVRCPHVERHRAGRRHVSSATLDFLVFRDKRIQLVECKTLEWLEAEVRKLRTDWKVEDDRWRNSAIELYASARGIEFVAWQPPSPAGIYLQNLQACYTVLDDAPPARRVVEAAVKRIRGRPSTIEQLVTGIPGFSARTALWMLASGVAYGPWKSIGVADNADFPLYADRERAGSADRSAMIQLQQAIAQPRITDRLALASAVDLARGRERLERLGRMMRGEEPWTRRFRELDNKVREGEANGESPLEVCLTAYQRSGNRTHRLLEDHYTACSEVLHRTWNSGRTSRPLDLYFSFAIECEARGIEPCSRWLLDTHRRQLDPGNHALSTGGMRAYQTVRPATDPRFRSLPPLGYGLVVHIDSSKFDVRLVVNDNGDTVLLTAIIYVAVDGASGRVMAHALMFGAARTDGLALLIRNYVTHHGTLPSVIHLDRGSENKSKWLRGFCSGRITIRRSPTAGSPWNGLAESTIKQINVQVAHRHPGSTLPDQAGRKADGRFKSYKTAKLTMSHMHEQLCAFLYSDCATNLGVDGMSPIERAAELLKTFGNFGTPCAYDDALLYATSLPIDLRKKFNRRRGIRTEDGWFTSDELKNAVRTNVIEEVRTDCERPDIMYVKVGGRIVKAFHNKVLSMARMDALDQQIELQFLPIARRLSRQQRAEGGRKRYTRMEYAKMRSGSEESSVTRDADEQAQAAPTLPSHDATTEVKATEDSGPREWRFDDLEPFPEDTQA
ncbi:hypothetical protein [Luteibacter sp. 3190]|uniref:hypothetical protein n=1 Tax=Luteibacter sp. 3190 TaxID=2817736 RepID=UPI00285D866B|nr:hypothetical protein [Luteibacter sp. 3190]MDR6937327.1 putative transposase [Luteibacter sp. 3190]